ncbi:GPW/gp25 family protein [Caulobacter endophyticus]|uniref:GPW/gp25 family protein n=1 Tax=Caulobacter endophyticus TaxID=2172652 RepID=UPI00240FCF7E|nr:GPW/gp25 family protein [Caulobacter endophyticus]MDG2527890.1 GPW/gp25 family protein [Caulobacter endophyticus]
MTQVAFPFRFDGGGVTARADGPAHVRDLIEQVLFTGPGERVMRPDFGSGVRQLVFAPDGQPLAIAVQMSVQAAINTWLGDLVEAAEVAVTAREETLQILVRYALRGDGGTVIERFERPLR